MVLLQSKVYGNSVRQEAKEYPFEKRLLVFEKEHALRSSFPKYCST